MQPVNTISKVTSVWCVYEVVGFQLLGDANDQIAAIGKARCKVMMTSNVGSGDNIV